MSLTTSYVGNAAKGCLLSAILISDRSVRRFNNFTILNSSYSPTGQVYSTPLYLLANRIDPRYGHIKRD